MEDRSVDGYLTPAQRISRLEGRVEELVNQMAFFKGAISVLAFLVGAGFLTTIIVILATSRGGP